MGTIDVISPERSKQAYLAKGVVVLRGGDHGAHAALEKGDFPERRRTAQKGSGLHSRPRRDPTCSGPGFCSSDLPWNPMDVEATDWPHSPLRAAARRSGLHNLVLSGHDRRARVSAAATSSTRSLDTSGKSMTEQYRRGLSFADSRSTLERLSYDRLYQEALSGPVVCSARSRSLVALANASEARTVVSSFPRPPKASVPTNDRLRTSNRPNVVTHALLSAHLAVDSCKSPRGDRVYGIRNPHGEITMRFTTDRELAQEQDGLDLVGLDNPLIEAAIALEGSAARRMWHRRTG